MSGNTNIKKKMGYTLIELIMVIALIGIVLSVAIPSFAIILRTAEKKELMEFKRDLIYARNSAVMENNIYSIEMDIANNQYFLLKGKENGMLLLKNKQFTNGIVLKDDNTNHYITFNPSGSPKNAGTIELTNKKADKIYITITPATGKINLKFNER